MTKLHRGRTFQEEIGCYCDCHIETDNVFSFRKDMHCDYCYDKRIEK